MKQAQHTRAIPTAGAGFYDITREIREWVEAQGVRVGLLTVFIPHTSAGLTIQENADPDVLDDLTDFLKRLAPADPRLYRHTTEGADDMPAHIRTVVTGVQLSIPVQEGRMTLGTWQGIYVAEHRAHPQMRRVILHLMGT
ncbi:MAG: YjbQ family protein [Alphaproteobacteria bacterium]|nr:YjbQ family protein [Alphaproteobacteria bacterium]